MPNKKINTIAGPAYLPGSSHWTDEEHEIWLKHEYAYADYVRAKIQMKDLGWNPRSGHWYEGGREKHGYRCTDPETQEKRVGLDDAIKRQEQRTPGFLPERPKKPDGLPTQKFPLFKMEPIEIKPMEMPVGALFNYEYKYK